ncbi:MAG: HEPN domain-containing protein [Bacteroidetes bacterium]|nr:MAG: HEPN domain-containing protein [Bacteroidota bacterium]
MTDDYREYIGQWFEKADHDIIAAKSLIEIRPLILDVACFHCQQAVEKYLKAFLVYKEVDFEKTHNIRLLQNKCAAMDADFSQLDFKNLNTFAVDARYPDFISPSVEEAKEYLIIAEKIKELVISKVKLA